MKIPRFVSVAMAAAALWVALAAGVRALENVALGWDPNARRQSSEFSKSALSKLDHSLRS